MEARDWDGDNKKGLVTRGKKAEEEKAKGKEEAIGRRRLTIAGLG